VLDAVSSRLQSSRLSCCLRRPADSVWSYQASVHPGNGRRSVKINSEDWMTAIVARTAGREPQRQHSDEGSVILVLRIEEPGFVGQKCGTKLRQPSCNGCDRVYNLPSNVFAYLQEAILYLTPIEGSIFSPGQRHCIHTLYHRPMKRR